MFQNGYGCKNHIRTIVVNEDKIYSCGTGSFSPVEYEFSVSIPFLMGNFTTSIKSILWLEDYIVVQYLHQE